jgi:hypothetical protein
MSQRRSKLARAALWYAKHGFWVLPLQENTKNLPMTKWRGLQTRPPDLEDIEQIWQVAPMSNIGLITGQYSRLVVVDCDTEQAERWFRERFRPSATPEAETLRGTHFYFSCSAPVPTYIKINGTQIDIKGDGSYVVAPPSIHPTGLEYKWKPGRKPNDVPLAPPPPGLLHWIQGDGDKNEAEKPGIEVVLRFGVDEGRRNESAARLAGHFFAMGLNRELVIEHLLRWNEKNQPPLPEEEIVQVVQSISRRHLSHKPPEVISQITSDPSIRPVQDKHTFNIIHAAKLLEAPPKTARWLWGGILSEGETSLLVAKPKVGKSTLALNLAVAVSRGAKFLGRSTCQSPVCYLALEEKAEEIRRRLKALAVTNEPLFLHIGMAPEEGVAELETRIVSEGLGLLIVDTLQKLIRVKDLNDYAQVISALEPVHEMARKTNCHILLTHHGVKGYRPGEEQILGSTGLYATVDTAIFLEGSGTYRTLWTGRQRSGWGMPPIRVIMNPDYSLSVWTPNDESNQEFFERIKTVLKNNPGLTRKELLKKAKARKQDVLSTVSWALKQNPPLLRREGKGIAGSPFRYFLQDDSPGPQLGQGPSMGGQNV